MRSNLYMKQLVAGIGAILTLAAVGNDASLRCRSTEADGNVSTIAECAVRPEEATRETPTKVMGDVSAIAGSKLNGADESVNQPPGTHTPNEPPSCTDRPNARHNKLALIRILAEVARAAARK